VIDIGGGLKDGIRLRVKNKKNEATLLELKFLLNSSGQVVVEKSTISPKVFREMFDKKMPEYPNTVVLHNFIRRVNTLAEQMIEDAEIF
tara:strand:- start:327 stop:593 length:267 start_codon:yes stop_codon:yes gene_type:complete